LSERKDVYNVQCVGYSE